MLKQATLYSIMIVLLASCASLKTAFTGNSASASANNSSDVKKETKFLDQIDVPVESSKGVKEKESEKPVAKKETVTTRNSSHREGDAENLSALQVKYAVLLSTPAEEVRNTKMLEFIDSWYGTPYRLGGATKKGIDCSAFSQFLFASVYGLSIPRTAKEQYNLTNRISRTQLKEGDLIFFNTRGGISHVGVYLQNNKFVHASTSGGVMISDIFDDYWARKFIGVGRLKDGESVVSSK
ncbi:MAG TPA: C40 family peptidase [Chitinophagaceae bacterium]|nr:C40 family peptidase [Chitinophagaceae bacterium]